MLVIPQPECRYESPIDGTPITSWAQRREDLARHNCEPYDPGRKEDYLRRQKESQGALDRAMDSTIEEAVELMPYKQRAKLNAELTEAGVTAEVERRTP